MPALTLRLCLTALFLLAATGCDSEDPGDDDVAGAVFTMTNAATSNEVVVFQRATDGALTRMASVATGGRGSGPPDMFPSDPFGSQDAVILSADHRFLFVVNAGSNEVSSFRVADDGAVALIGKAPSGGGFPLSLTLRGDLLYVLNSAGPGNISGLRVAADGTLTPLAGSTQPLSGIDTPLPGNAVAPADVNFSPDGRMLVVTEKATSMIDVYQVGTNGLPGPPNVQPSVTPTPFGAEFDRNGFLVVSETNATGPRMPVPNGASVTSYRLSAAGVLSPVSAAVPTRQTAACWIEITADNRYAYTTNTASGTITGFRLGADGTLVSLNPSDGLTATVGPMSVLLDMAISGEYLYVLAVGNNGVSGFHIESDGRLTAVPAATVGGLPGASTEGLAAF